MAKLYKVSGNNSKLIRAVYLSAGGLDVLIISSIATVMYLGPLVLIIDVLVRRHHRR